MAHGLLDTLGTQERKEKLLGTIIKILAMALLIEYRTFLWKTTTKKSS